jgi:hypothetical protein
MFPTLTRDEPIARGHARPTPGAVPVPRHAAADVAVVHTVCFLFGRPLRVPAVPIYEVPREYRRRPLVDIEAAIARRR